MVSAETSIKPNARHVPQSTVDQKPLIRWAGGKRSLADRLSRFLPTTYARYYEPMIGGGALFFAVNPKRAVLADINPELMNFYKILKNHPSELHTVFRRFRANKKSYYVVRAQKLTSSIRRAARLLYLIRLSWNGLYRVNRQGYFNVPYSYRRPKQLLTVERLLSASKVLKGARLVCGDFEISTADIEPEDFVYFDPPYPKGAASGNGFARYSATGFTLEDHRRLARYASKLADRGAHVMITEACRKEILNLYSRSFHQILVRNRSLIAGDSTARRDAYEAVLTSYRVNI